MRHLLSRFLGSARGTTAIEYSLIAGGVALAIITIVNTLGSSTTLAFFNEALKIAPAS